MVEGVDRVVVTGTPGTGKTTVSEEVARQLGFETVHLNQMVEEREYVLGYDSDRETAVTDVEALREELEDEREVVIEGHLSHYLEADHAVVLRCRPDVLARRLLDRGYDDGKVRENAESEALDVVLAEALEEHDVYEVDTTDLEPDEVVEEVVEGVRNQRERHGEVDWSEFVEGVDVEALHEGDEEAKPRGEG
ncbi:MAG: AAA family ATPase [Halobacteria archaeon]|nr:AAA family ATPase [Halobacteria archaeon]